MKVSQLGEFGLVNLFAETIQKSRDNQAESWQRLLLGIGDDTAAWNWDNSIQLATVDSLVQDIHFPPGSGSWEDLGWKALAINLSDIAAMGGRPLYALVYLGLSPETDVDDVLALYRGMIKLAQQHGVAVVGGDTDSMPRVTVTVTVIGSARRDMPLLTRSSVKLGDQIAVTGYLGSAAAGFKILQTKKKVSPKDASFLKEAFLRPSPRIAEGQILVEQGVRAAIDISDGLLSDLEHICKASGVGAHVEAEKIPINTVLKDNFAIEEALELALSGGEDYELLFTGTAEMIDRIKKLASCPVTVIGEITTEYGVTVTGAGGRILKINKKGWEHFISKDE